MRCDTPGCRVLQATLVETGELVAVKKVLQDKRFKNRELQIMKQLRHTNVVELKNCYYSKGDKADEVYLNLVLEFVPETIYRIIKVLKSTPTDTSSRHTPHLPAHAAYCLQRRLPVFEHIVCGNWRVVTLHVRHSAALRAHQATSADPVRQALHLPNRCACRRAC